MNEDNFDTYINTREYNRTTSLDNARPMGGNSAQVFVTLNAVWVAKKLVKSLKGYEYIEFEFQSDEEAGEQYEGLKRYFREYKPRKYKNRLMFSADREDKEIIETNDTKDEDASEEDVDSAPAVQPVNT